MKILVATLLILAAAGTAYATIPDGDGTIHACYADNGGALRVLDPSTGATCAKREHALSWNEQGQPGPAGSPGPAGAPGPPGASGAPASIDDLGGVRCKGIRSKPGTIRVDYGSGLDAPVTLTCQTHLVANPGPFTLHVTQATLTLPLLGELGLPADGWHVSGTIDFQGKVAVPGPIFDVTGLATQGSAPLGGLANVHVAASLAVTATGLTGMFDPEQGTPRIEGGIYATLTLAFTIDSGTLYAGTCSLGSAASPIGATLTTDAPGRPYSQATGSVPSLDSCVPAMPALYAFLVDAFAGPGRITVAGTTSPVLAAT
jgi:hypothetical protein